MAPRKKATPCRQAAPFKCSICFTTQTRRVVLECKHELCFSCARAWKKTGGAVTCPMCRAPSLVLQHLQSRCPPIGPDGVSTVVVKPPPKNKSLLHIHCKGCNKYVHEKQCTRDPHCGKHTCNACRSFIQGFTLSNDACVHCLIDELGLGEMAAAYVQHEGLINIIGIDLDSNAPYVPAIYT